MIIRKPIRYMIYGSVIAIGLGLGGVIGLAKYQEYRLVQELGELKSTRTQIEQVVECAENLSNLNDIELQLRKEGYEFFSNFQTQFDQQVKQYDDGFKRLNEGLGREIEIQKGLEKRFQDLNEQIRVLSQVQPVL